MINESRQRFRYIVADFLSTGMAVLLFNVVRYYDLPAAYTGFASLTSFLCSPILIVGQILFPTVMLLIYYLSGYYTHVYVKSRTSEFSTTLITAAIGTLLMIFATLLNDLTNDRIHDYNLFLILLGLLFAVVYLPRLAITSRTARLISQRRICFNTLIVGYSSAPDLYTRQINGIEPSTAICPVALIDSDNHAETLADIDTALPAFDIDNIAEVCHSMHIERLIVIPHPDGWEHTLETVHRLLPLSLSIYIAAGSLPVYLFRSRLMNLTAEPFIDISRNNLPASTINIKRAFDVVASSLLLAVSAIPILILALAVRINSDGPAFYRQRRVGLHGRQFDIIKLRSMINKAEPDGNPQLSHPDDHRVTGIGRILRKYRLDELPQLINVLRGDMSIVGPRPERPHYAAMLLERDPAYALIHCVRPGLTSLGMVKYGYASDVEQMLERLKYDLLYLENISVTTDLKIILHTAHTVLSGKGV